MPLMARNTLAGPLVLTKKEYDLKWEGAGDPMGGDTQRAPDAITDDLEFLRCVDAGILVIESATDSVQSALARQSQTFKERQAQQQAATEATLDRVQSNDMIALECVGPNVRGTGDCGSPVMVRDRTRDAKPPLCTKHEGLVSQFVPTEDIDAQPNSSGRKPTKWVRVQHDKQ